METILILQKKNGSVRSVDIAAELRFSKPSISRAMGILRKAEYITMDGSGYIHLTEKGRKKAEDVYERHQILSRYFVEVLGVSPDTAAQDACRVEHIISGECFQCIKKALQELGKIEERGQVKGNPQDS